MGAHTFNGLSDLLKQLLLIEKGNHFTSFLDLITGGILFMITLELNSGGGVFPFPLELGLEVNIRI